MAKTLEERFWPKVDTRAPCWEWTGARQSTGYGNFWLGPGAGYGRAHRVAYELLVGPIPDGLHLDHLCRNRGCVNPDHLEPVTPGENLRRQPRMKVTHCPKGHPYSGDNLHVRKDRPGRGCKMCRLEQMRQSKARNRRPNA